MKYLKFVTGLLLALVLISFVSMTSPMKVLATENGVDQEKAQAILPDTLSEEDEKAINVMISAYQRSRSAAPEQLEAKISDYFEAKGTARAIYVVEFKSHGKGSVGGRLVYVLMGNDALKYLNQASGGFVVPETKAEAGYGFSHWSMNGTVVESEELSTYSISGSSIFYAEFMPDINGDGIPDHKQRKFNIQFSEENTHGTVVGNKLDFVVFEPINGEECYISQAVGFQVPDTTASPGYAFDYWVTNEEKVVEEFDSYRVNTNLVISAVFAVDSNYDGIPDHKQTLYEVDFVAASGGSVSGETHFIAAAMDNGLGEWMGNLEVMYPFIWDSALAFTPDDGYMLEYWIDHRGGQYYADQSLSFLNQYTMHGDTVFVAVFAEDVNGNDVPDYRENIN